MNKITRIMRQKLAHSDWKPTAIFTGVALAILLPLLGPGYIFSLDMVFPPIITIPTEITNTYVFYSFLHVLNIVLPSWFIQKVVLFAVFFGAGIGAYRLSRDTQGLYKTQGWITAYYFAGLLYAINPFTYTRLMAGQYEVLLGYALLPFLLRTALLFFDHPTIHKTIRLGLWLLAISIVSIHTFGIALIILALTAGVFCWRHRRRITLLKRGAAYLAAAGAGIAILSSYWVLPLVQGQGKVALTISDFNVSDQVAFQTVPGELGLPWNVLAMQGFWGDTHSLYALPQDAYGWWWLPLILAVCIISIGIGWSWRRQRLLAAVFSSILVVGVVLSTGTADTLFAPINSWFTNHIALFKGYREPQKFVMLIVLAYVYFGSAGMLWITRWLSRHKLQHYALVGLLVPIAVTPLLFWGANGQLQSRQYPSDWYALNNYLRQNTPQSSKTLFLPWHLYMPYGFSERVIASPAPKFFGSSILSSNDPEIKDATGYATTPDVSAVTSVLADAITSPQFVSRLRALSVRYIIVAKDFDYRTYDYLQAKPGITLVTDSTNYKLYRIGD